MGILTTADKEKVKRAVPKASNKIIDATVARLYIAHPDPNAWTYTGLVGAIALVDDLVGHTFFLKLVDIIGTRGVIWDQELYVNFDYHQDRKFFHTFEIEDCLVGLLFEDTSDAAHFFKRVSNRTKYASKDTAKNKNAIALKDKLAPEATKIGPRGEYVDVTTDQRTRRARGVLYYDDQPPPEWRLLYAELAAAGITEDMIAENRQFIKDYIAKQGGPLVGLEPPIPRRHAAPHNVFADHAPEPPAAPPKKTKKAPPPPPPQGVTPQNSQTPELTPTPTNMSSSGEVTPTHSSDGSPAPSKLHTELKFRVPPSNAPVPQVSHTNIPPPQTDQSRPLPSIPQQGGSIPGQQQRPPMFDGSSSLYGQPIQGLQPPPPPPGRTNSNAGAMATPPARGNPHLLRLEVIPLRPHKEVALLHLLHRELNRLDTLRLHREPVLLLHLLQELLVERLLRLRREVFELNLKLLKPRFLNLLNHFSNHCSLNSHQLSHINPLNWLTSRLSRLKGPLNRHQSHHPHHQLLNLSSRSHNLILLLLPHHLLCLLKILPHLVEPHPHLRLLQT